MPTTSRSPVTTTDTIYEVSVVFTLHNTDREVADEFVAARDLTEIDPTTLEVVRDVVAPTTEAAYRRGVNLVCAVLDAAGLVDQYSLGDIRVEVVA